MAKNISIGHISNLPIHMSNMNNTFMTGGELAVIRDEVSPTLLIADATSKSTWETF